MTDWPSPAEAREALAQGRGRGVRIALLDSGVETSHPQLRRLRLCDDLVFIAREGRITSEPGDGSDPYGHGTAVAGLVHELAPEAEIGSFRVLGPQLNSRTGIAAAAAHAALDRGYHVLNCSFGCGLAEHIHFYKEWIDRAWLAGAQVVAACNNHRADHPEWPAHLLPAIGVDMAAGLPPEGLARREGLVEFALLGVDVRVPWCGGGFRQMTGSSLAAPRLTGLLARLLSVYPDLDPAQIRALLRRLAQPA